MSVLFDHHLLLLILENRARVLLLRLLEMAQQVMSSTSPHLDLLAMTRSLTPVSYLAIRHPSQSLFHSVTENELLYKYPIVLGADTDIYAAIKEIEAEINNRLVTQMRCALSRTRRNLLVANLVGANSNPSDLPSNDVCEDEKGECVVIDGGLTVYGDVDIQEVQDFITAVLPSIVESAGASVIDSMMTSNATLESRSASANSGSGTITTVAIAGAALVALIGAAVFMRKKKSYNNMSDESEAVLMGEFPQKAPSPREVPHASSDDSDTLLCSESFESKSRRSVFRKKPHNGEALPSSPAFSVSSSKSKSKDIADTVDL